MGSWDFVGAESVGEAILVLLCVVPVAAVSDYFLTPCLQALHTWGDSQDEVRRRGIAVTGLTVVLIVIFAIGFFVPMGS